MHLSGFKRDKEMKRDPRENLVSQILFSQLRQIDSQVKQREPVWSGD